MRITVVTPACHFPSKGATQQDIYCVINYLADMGHNVSVVSLDQPGQDNLVLSDALLRNKIPYKTYTPKKSTLSVALKNKIPALLDGSAQAFFDLVNSDVWQNCIKEFKPEIILSIGTYSWPVAVWGKKKGLRVAIRSHNFEPKHFWEELTIKHKFNPINWARLIVKWLSEIKAVRVPDVLAAISPREVDEYKKIGGQSQIALLPLVSLLYIKGNLRDKNKPVIDLFFLGATYNVPFHEWGAKELILNIAPKVEAKAPDTFRFHICGSKLPKYLVAACDGNKIIYEGYVKNLDEFFGNMDAGVFPVWSGRGMKQKIFESICRGFPVVVPNRTIGEYPLVDNDSALIAETDNVFIDKIVSLGNINTRVIISRGALNFSSRNFSQTNFDSYFKEILGNS